VGFSYGDRADYATNEETVAEDLYHFMQVCVCVCVCVCMHVCVCVCAHV
jgi:hypothetical protein